MIVNHGAIVNLMVHAAPPSIRASSKGQLHEIPLARCQHERSELTHGVELQARHRHLAAINLPEPIDEQVHRCGSHNG
eukprot:COSAG01_NODE_2628_length_7351_cov_3.274645_11_plen_78_part_00